MFCRSLFRAFVVGCMSTFRHHFNVYLFLLPLRCIVVQHVAVPPLSSVQFHLVFCIRFVCALFFVFRNRERASEREVERTPRWATYMRYCFVSAEQTNHTQIHSSLNGLSGVCASCASLYLSPSLSHYSQFALYNINWRHTNKRSEIKQREKLRFLLFNETHNQNDRKLKCQCQSINVLHAKYKNLGPAQRLRLSLPLSVCVDGLLDIWRASRLVSSHTRASYEQSNVESLFNHFENASIQCIFRFIQSFLLSNYHSTASNGQVEVTYIRLISKIDPIQFNHKIDHLFDGESFARTVLLFSILPNDRLKCDSLHFIKIRQKWPMFWRRLNLNSYSLSNIDQS